MNFIERSQLERINQITNSLQKDLQNRDNYLSNLNNQRNMYPNETTRIQNLNDPDKYPDYDTLQNMYMQSLNSNIPPEYITNNQQYNINQVVDKPYSAVSNNYHNYGNTQSLQNERPYSVPDNKKKQQEEYRKILQNQMREQQERKHKEKLESRGLDIVNKRPISTNSTNSNAATNITQTNNVSNITNSNTNNPPSNLYSNPNFQYSNILSGYPQNYSTNKNYPNNNGNNDPQLNYISKQQFENLSNLIKNPINAPTNNSNYHNSNQQIQKQQEVIDFNLTNQNPPKNNNVTAQIDEKQVEKQRKLEYQNILKKQMEEKNKRIEEEKKKRMEEERRIEEQFKIMMEKEKEKEKVLENQKKAKQNIVDNHNNPTTNNTKQSNNKINQQNNTNMGLQNSNLSQQNTLTENRNNVNINNFNPSLTQEYMNYKDKQTFIPQIENQEYYNHPHFENNPYENPVDQYSEQRDMNQRSNYHTQQTFKFPQQSSSNFNPSSLPQNPNYQDYIPQETNINQNFYPIPNLSQSNYGMKPQTNQYMIPSLVDDMCRQFWAEQMKLINQYQQNVYEVMKERDNAIKDSLLMREKMFLHNQLQIEQEKIKKSVGYIPFDNNTYYNNLEEMFNNPKLTSSTFNNNNVNPYKSISQKNMNNNLPESGSSTFRNINKLNNNNNKKNQSFSPKKNSNKYGEINYDEMAESSIYEQSGNYQCLDGVSKLVKIVPKSTLEENDENEQFYETWRDDETMNNISKMILNKQNNIAESLKKSQNEKEPPVNINKVNSSINNTSKNKNLLSKSIANTVDPPQKDLSIINKTSNLEKPEKFDKTNEVKKEEKSIVSQNKIESVINKTINDKNTSLVVNRDKSEVIVNSEENYEASFEVIEENISGDEGKKEDENEQPKEEINLDEYKEIHQKDNEKFKTKVNFFESDGNLLRPGINTTNVNQNNLAETINNNRESAQEKMEKYSIIRKGFIIFIKIIITKKKTHILWNIVI